MSERNAWIGPYATADEALEALRRACADILGADPEQWPNHKNAPLAIAAAPAPSGWIACSERMPEAGSEVLVCAALAAKEGR